MLLNQWPVSHRSDLRISCYYFLLMKLYKPQDFILRKSKCWLVEFFEFDSYKTCVHLWTECRVLFNDVLFIPGEGHGTGDLAGEVEKRNGDSSQKDSGWYSYWTCSSCSKYYFSRLKTLNPRGIIVSCSLVHQFLSLVSFLKQHHWKSMSRREIQIRYWGNSLESQSKFYFPVNLSFWVTVFHALFRSFLEVNAPLWNSNLAINAYFATKKLR